MTPYPQLPSPPLLLLLASLAACDAPPDQPHPLDQPTAESDMPAVSRRDTSYHYDCRGEVLPLCEPGWAGSSCDHPCSPGFEWCRIEPSCHADGRVYGLAGLGTQLFALPSSSPDADEVLTHLEAWISAHEADLGLTDGLSPSLLQLEPLAVDQRPDDVLRLFRFYQYHSTAAGPALVVGDGSIITVEVGPQGVVSMKGTISDPRQPFNLTSNPASQDAASASIRQHVAERTGIPHSQLRVEDLALVAVPGANVVAWEGVVFGQGQLPLATVIVVATQQAPLTPMPLLSYDTHTANGLDDTTDIEVRSEDLGTDVLGVPISEATVTDLLDGSSLQGSSDDFTGSWQLATEAVVAIDVLGNALDQVKKGDDFARYTDAAGNFDATQPSPLFDAQRHYHLSQEAYALVNYLTAGAWDSALPLFHDTMADPANPAQTIHVPKSSDYEPGRFRPRILAANNHAPLGGPAGQAGFADIVGGSPIAEIHQSPGPGLEPEAIAFLNLPSGSANVKVLMHELGHAFDVFLGPGFPSNYVPPCMFGCDETCDENTSDEALPLTETIAQMFTLWQLQRIGGLAHDDCDVIDAVMTGAGQGSTLVHHPACMGNGDQISLFLREDDPACLDPTFCDKPTHNENDLTKDQAHLCDATAGYNVASLLQVWWNTLHGQYCESTPPFSCDPLPPVAWPAGCNAPGSTVECATHDELAALPLIHALRTNPLSYEDLIDEMARFVACNYGEESYTWFNQSLCDHHLRGCGEPPPMICQTCGNGIREGIEQCDGLDMSLPELGASATCESVGYESGVLQCDAMCMYDFGMCVGPAPVPAGSSSDDGADPAGDDTTSWGDTETTRGSGGASDPGGCDCRADGGRGTTSGLLGMMALLMLGRRGRGRRRPVRRARARSRSLAGAASLGAVVALGMTLGCGIGPSVAKVGAGDGSEEETTSTGTEDLDESGTEIEDQGEDMRVWPKESLGMYYFDGGLPLGISGMYLFGTFNLELRRDTLRITQLSCDGEASTTEYPVSFEGDEVHVYPERGETHVMWLGAPYAEELIFRPGPTCRSLETEIVELVHSNLDPTWNWLRGAVYVSDTCEDDDEWAVDLVPGVPTDCG